MSSVPSYAVPLLRRLNSPDRLIHLPLSVHVLPGIDGLGLPHQQATPFLSAVIGLPVIHPLEEARVKPTGVSTRTTRRFL